jgi:hypothetical protein
MCSQGVSGLEQSTKLPGVSLSLVPPPLLQEVTASETFDADPEISKNISVDFSQISVQEYVLHYFSKFLPSL